MTTEPSGITTLQRGLDQMATLLATVQAEDLTRPTPCQDWTVKDLVAHIVQGPANFAVMVRGDRPDWSTVAELDEDGWADAFRNNADELVATWREYPQAQPGPGFQIAELAVHAYDLATALGRGADDLDPEVGEEAYAVMSTSLTPDNRGSAFAEEQPAPEDADPYQRVAAFAGRTV